MHNKVVYRIARRIAAGGRAWCCASISGRSGPERRRVHDHGNGEVEDARAALNFLRERYPKLPWSMAGFSFGSRVIMKLGCSAWRSYAVLRLIAVGFLHCVTVKRSNIWRITCAMPKYFVQSTNDEHTARRTNS